MIRLNGSPLNVTLFPDNTSQVWKIPETSLKDCNYAYITWEFSHEGEFMHLAQLKTLLDRDGFKCDLVLKYLPYGRQDKPVSNETTFALRTFANLLNSLKFDNVTIIDPHSKVALEIINNSESYYPTDTVSKVMALTGSEIVVYPDEGALFKYNQKVYLYPYMYGVKVRDQLTGNITSYELSTFNTTFNHIKKKVLIIDDICDGGMTFKLLADALLKKGAAEVNLFVTHGIFSKGLKTLKDSGINKVFTKDGEVSEDHNNNLIYRRL